MSFFDAKRENSGSLCYMQSTAWAVIIIRLLIPSIIFKNTPCQCQKLKFFLDICDKYMVLLRNGPFHNAEPYLYVCVILIKGKIKIKNSFSFVFIIFALISSFMIIQAKTECSRL